MVKSYSKLFMTVYLLLHAMANGILLLLSLWGIACLPRYLLMYDTQKASNCDRALTEIRGGEKLLSAQIRKLHGMTVWVLGHRGEKRFQIILVIFCPGKSDCVLRKDKP